MMKIKKGTSYLFDCRMLMKSSFNIKRFSKIKIKNHRLSFRDRNKMIIFDNNSKEEFIDGNDVDQDDE